MQKLMADLRVNSFSERDQPPIYQAVIPSRLRGRQEMSSNSRLDPRAAPTIDSAAIDRALARARRERAEALRAWAGRLSGWLRRRVVEPARRARQRRLELDALLSLNDRTLADIGLHRHEIKAMVQSGVPLRRPAPQPASSPPPGPTSQPAVDPARATATQDAGKLAKAA